MRKSDLGKLFEQVFALRKVEQSCQEINENILANILNHNFRAFRRTQVLDSSRGKFA